MSDERSPAFVHCRDCGHEWPAFYTPIEMGVMVKLTRKAACPMCGADGKQILMGRKTKEGCQP